MALHKFCYVINVYGWHSFLLSCDLTPLSNIVCNGTHGNVFLYNSSNHFRHDHSLYERTILLRTVGENECSISITRLHYTFLHFVVLRQGESTPVLHKSNIRSGTSHNQTEMMMMSASTLPLSLPNLKGHLKA